MCKDPEGTISEASAHQRVPAQRGLVGEGASAQAAHVRLLPGVDALVPLQRVELGELLLAFLTAVRTLAWQSTERETGSERSGARKTTSDISDNNSYLRVLTYFD